jgi:hypothetical protein
MFILKEGEYYQVENFCSLLNGDYPKTLSIIEELVKREYLKTIIYYRNINSTTYSDDSKNGHVPVRFYLVIKEIGIVNE